jgi:hypothetical protein
MCAREEDSMPSDKDLRARFDAELTVAGLTLSGSEYDDLYEMWAEHLPERERLRAAVLAPDEEPWR